MRWLVPGYAVGLVSVFCALAGTPGCKGHGPSVISGQSVDRLAVGVAHVCAVVADGTLRCWGRADRGQLGDGTRGEDDSGQRTSPVLVRGATSIEQVSVGLDHTCSLGQDDRTVRCWGSNDFGQVGDGQAGDRMVPVLLPTLQGVRSLTLGAQHSCALLEDATARCWGRNDQGQLGDGTRLPRTTPVRVALDQIALLEAGAHHTCAQRLDRTVWCWGRNDEGQLGLGIEPSKGSASWPTPMRVSTLTQVDRLVPGVVDTCAVKQGKLWCWGRSSWTSASDTGHLIPTEQVGIPALTSIGLGAWSEATFTPAFGSQVQAKTDAQPSEIGVSVQPLEQDDASRGDVLSDARKDLGAPTDVRPEAASSPDAPNASSNDDAALASRDSGMDDGQDALATLAGSGTNADADLDADHGSGSDALASTDALEDTPIEASTDGAVDLADAQVARPGGNDPCWEGVANFKATTLACRTGVCGVDPQGLIWCWGSSASTADAGPNTPRVMSGMDRASVAGLRGALACALLLDGGVRCWLVYRPTSVPESVVF